MVTQRVRDIALEVRRRIEAEVRSNPDPDQDHYVNRRTLGGACARASYALAEALDWAGIRCTFVYGNFYDHGHCWVEVDGTIVDITATQFSTELPEVYVTALDPRYAGWAYDEDAFDLVSHWPFEQRPQPRA